jgi:hypothetical protein
MVVNFILQYAKAATSVFKMGRLMYYSIKLHAAVVYILQEQQLNILLT